MGTSESLELLLEQVTAERVARERQREKASFLEPVLTVDDSRNAEPVQRMKAAHMEARRPPPRRLPLVDDDPFLHSATDLRAPEHPSRWLSDVLLFCDGDDGEPDDVDLANTGPAASDAQTDTSDEEVRECECVR